VIDQCFDIFTHSCHIIKLSDSLANDKCVLCEWGDIVIRKSLSFFAGVVGYFNAPVYFLDCPNARGGLATKFGMSMFMLPFGIIATI
jgi:hypothetical protein